MDTATPVCDREAKPERCRPPERKTSLQCRHPTWYVLDRRKGCGATDHRVGLSSGTGGKKFLQQHTLQHCMKMCEAERATVGCKAIDFFPKSGSCARYSRVCRAPSTAGASSFVLGCQDPCVEGTHSYTGSPCTPRTAKWARLFRRQDALFRVRVPANGSIGRRQRARLEQWLEP